MYANRSTVIDYLQNQFNSQNVGVAYIYFDYKNHEIQNGRNIAASLLQQLAARSDYLDPGLEKTYDELTARRETPGARSRPAPRAAIP